MVLRGKLSRLAQAMYVYNDTENFLTGMRADEFGSWYTQVWCLIQVMWVDVKKDEKSSKNIYSRVCDVVSALICASFLDIREGATKVLCVCDIDMSSCR